MDASSQNQSVKFNVAKWIFFGLSVSLSLFLIINGAIPGETSAAESNGISAIIANVINAIKSDTITDANFNGFAQVIRKLLGHFLAFLVDGVFVSLACYFFLIKTNWYKFYYPIVISLGTGLIVASISELLQVFTNERYGSFVDIGIDMGGFVIGAAIVFLILFSKKKLIVSATN